MNSSASLSPFLLALAATATAHAQIADIGPFTGSRSETWESYAAEAPIAGASGVASIMGGTAALLNSNASEGIVAFALGGFSLGTSGNAVPADGTRLAGAWASTGGGSLTIIFTDPITQFGAYFGAFTGSPSPDPAQVEVRFLNNFLPVGTSQFFQYSRSASGTDGILEWHGWSSSVPVDGVVISSPDAALAVDGLQVVPEPKQWALLGGVGLLGFAIYRRCRRA